MKKCRFCAKFSDIQAANEINRADEMTDKYKCAIADETYFRRKYKGRTTHYINSEIKYCPECGRKL